MSETTKGVLAFMISALIVAISFFITLFMSLPSTVVYGQDFGLRREINTVATQTFGFFTKDPKSQDFLPLSNEEGYEGESLLTTPQGKPENWFGIKRKQRAQGPEMASLGNHTVRDKIECDGSLRECFIKATHRKAVAVTNTSPIPTLCGKVVLLIVEPTPFQYRKQIDSTLQASGAIYLDITCDRQVGYSQ